MTGESAGVGAEREVCDVLDVWSQLGWIAAGTCVLMVVLWGVQVRMRNATVVDAGWAASLGAAAVFAAATGEGDVGRRVLIGVMGGMWGARLAWHVVGRVTGGKEEDGRYQLLREHFGARINLFHFFFFQAQAASVVVLCAPFLLAARDPGAFPMVLDVLGGLVWLVGLVGETAADRQLHAFKRDPASKGKTCRRGLWRYSRHPNYFFEWTMWVGYALVASGGAAGWWLVGAWLSPLVILVLVVKVTGIPPTEKRALKTRGEDYRAYQRTTSAFVPWFPKGSMR